MQTMMDDMHMQQEEIQQLKQDILNQERDLRIELCDDFEQRRKKRSEEYEKRLQHSKALAIKPLQSKVMTKKKD
jgi:hypothetical protein